MEKLTADQINLITNAGTVQDALRVTGEIGQAHFVRKAFIAEIMGPRATQGYFNSTRANVTRKFRHAWELAQQSND